MSQAIAQARCFTHAHREAAAKCPQCGKFYCRECVTEHEGRVMCRTCLDALLEQSEVAGPGWLRAVGSWALSGVGFLFAIYCFYQIGRVLLRIPSKFHTGVFFE